MEILPKYNIINKIYIFINNDLYIDYEDRITLKFS